MEFDSINLPLNKKEVKIENKLIDLTRDQLIDLVKNGGITRGLLLAEAVRNKTSIFKVGIAIIAKCGLYSEYIQQEDKNDKNSTIEKDKDLIFSFLKKKQRPKNEHESQPDAVLSQTPEIPIPESTVIPEIIHPAQSIENINKPERKNWWEVKRETEVMAVEDLDGSMEMFKKHVTQLGVAKKDAKGGWQWKGGNKKLVFLGDILGDRGMDGMQITSIIGNLSEQAQKQGGQVDFLCGNHDVAVINFLCGNFSDDLIKKNSEIIMSQYTGILELTQFDSELSLKFKETKLKNSREYTKEILLELNRKIPEILESMKTNPKGLEILESICKIKAMVVHDDALYCHTDPTSAMIADLIRDGNISQRVLEINKIFQENLKSVLFNGMKLNDDFRKIEKTYFNTNNRVYFVEENSFDDIANNLYERLGMDVENLAIEKNIEEWKHENGIKEDYSPDIYKIINELNNGNQEEARKLHYDLFERIKESFIEKVKYSGINAVIHGHSPRTDRYYDENDLIIISPHALFQNNGSNHENGISIIKTNGRINLFGKSFRKQKPAAILSQKPLAPKNKPTKQEQKKEAVSESMKKMTELFSNSKLSRDVIKEEAAKNQMKPSELAIQFIEGAGNLKWQFKLRLNSLFYEGIKDDEAIEMVATLMILESERNKLQEIIRTKGGDNILRLRLGEIIENLKKLTKEIYKKQDEIEKF